MSISADQLRRLLRKEGRKVDLKLTLPLKTKDDKAKFVKHVIALANTPRGTGYLLIGVDDKTKKPKETPPPEAIEEDIQRILSTYCQPLVETDYGIVKIKGGSVGALSIYQKSVDLPYRVKKTVGGGKNMIEVDEIFIRHGRLSEKPTYPEHEALILEGYRAREKAKREKPLEPSKDDYTYMSVQSRLQQMRKDLLQEMRRLGLKPILSARKSGVERWVSPRYGLVEYYGFLASNVRLAQVTEHKTTGLIIFYLFPDNFCRDEYRLINEEDTVPVASRRDIDKYGQARRQLTNHSFRLAVALVYGAIYKSAFNRPYYHEVIPLPRGYHLKPIREKERDWFELNHRLYFKQIRSKEKVAEALGWVLEWIGDHISELTGACGAT